MSVIKKSLCGLQDLLLGRQQVIQNRGGLDIPVDGIDIHAYPTDIAALKDIDPAQFKLARIYNEDNYDEYVYSETNLTGVPSNIGSGSWVLRTVVVLVAAEPPATVNVSADFVIPPTLWYVLRVDASAGDVTITTPTLDPRALLTIKKVNTSGGDVIITGADPIEGDTQLILQGYLKPSVDLKGSDTEWWIK